jgi:hypothetical protein
LWGRDFCMWRMGTYAPPSTHKCDRASWPTPRRTCEGGGVWVLVRRENRSRSWALGVRGATTKTLDLATLVSSPTTRGAPPQQATTTHISVATAGAMRAAIMVDFILKKKRKDLWRRFLLNFIRAFISRTSRVAPSPHSRFPLPLGCRRSHGRARVDVGRSAALRRVRVRRFPGGGRGKEQGETAPSPRSSSTRSWRALPSPPSQGSTSPQHCAEGGTRAVGVWFSKEWKITLPSLVPPVPHSPSVEAEGVASVFPVFFVCALGVLTTSYMCLMMLYM